MESIISNNQEFVNTNLIRKITSKVLANQGHTRFILVDKYVNIRLGHECVKMRVVIMTDKENSLYYKKACLNNVEKFAGQKFWPATLKPANLSQMRICGRCHLGCWAPAAQDDTTAMQGDFQTDKNEYRLGFDTEWVEVQGKRFILSYQIAMYVADQDLLEFILFPEGHRISMGRLLSIFREELKYELDIDIKGYVKGGKEYVLCNLISHYSIVDLTTFFDKMNILRNTDTIRRTQVSITKPLFIDVYDRNYHNKQIWVVKVRDTLTLAPAGSSLAQLAKAMGKLKLELPLGYGKDDMARFLKEQEEEFMMYACNDATLALDYVKRMYPESKIPVTLGSEGADIFREKIKEINDWNDKEFDFHVRGLLTIRDNNRHTKLVARPEAAAALEMANHAYYGGRNECFLYGIHHANEWNDYDLSGAYPTVMSFLRNPDFTKITALTGDIVSINPLDYIFGLVDFEFPDHVMYPCLPVKDLEGRGLIFPRRGRTFASAPELYAALKMGAKLRWVQPAIQVGAYDDKFDIQWALTDLLKARAEAKKLYGKGSVQEVKLKEMINSIYGKTAQGLAGKRNYSTRTDKVEDTPPSSITQPILAAMTTSLVRAIVSVAMHQLHERGYRIASVTTDGFLTDAPFEVLNSLSLFGFKALYEAVRNMMVGDPTMWEIKHKCKTLIMITTRGGIG